MVTSIDAAVSIAVNNGIRRAVAQGFTGVGRQLEAFVKGMDIGSKGDQSRVHKAIAEEVRFAVVNAYEDEVEATRKVPSYNRFDRRSGYLGRVVRRRNLVSGDAEGVHFIDEATLDKEAAHWRRLNFGAGRAAGPQPGPVSIRLFGEAVVQGGFGYGASPGFALPKGFFIQGGKAVIPNSGYRGRGSVGKFIPSRKSPYDPQETEGIRGRHFMEAGLDAMAREFPIKYADLLNDWILRGGRKARAVAKVTG